MLSSLRLTDVRRLLVIAMVIISGFVVLERSQAVINDLQHKLDIAHADAGMTLASAAVDAADDHHGDPADRDATGSDASGPKHHHMEVPQVGALAAPAPQPAQFAWSQAMFVAPQARVGPSPVSDLERPPKARSTLV